MVLAQSPINGNKSEAILCGTRQSLRTFRTFKCCHCWFSSATISKYYCSRHYHILFLNKHTSSICQSVYFHLTALSHVRPTLTDDITTASVVTLVRSLAVTKKCWVIINCQNSLSSLFIIKISYSSSHHKIYTN